MDRISTIHRLEHWLYNHHLNILGQILRGVVRIVFSADVPPSNEDRERNSFSS